jgi:hypothetical protein
MIVNQLIVIYPQRPLLVTGIYSLTALWLMSPQLPKIGLNAPKYLKMRPKCYLLGFVTFVKNKLMKKLLTTFLLLSVSAFAEVKTIVYAPWELNRAEQKKKIEEINGLIRDGWRIVQLTHQHRIVIYTLEKL